ncbi:BTAD domain-containing putative transcriptional regulator [Kribbella sp. CA-293567]|uniref:BTAD domain-containing putative transcriptional regulator n=1 Tax=Kribbella sp. CA-293567 TaxID=3002436 RepID=UPI0022DE8C56|nr:BTAD domain-containing putative transcriptional regulator [Kribbella sp. CA-293567]WBQ04750.1 BTAD domain-containing putative transcriptional regulator [Kribbella sp. CA-293567]
MSGRSPHDFAGDAPAHGPPGRLGELLRSLRWQADLTQRELADRAGLSTAAIRDLEQGRTRSPKPDSVDAIAAVLALGSDDAGKLHAAARSHRSPAAPTTGALWIGVLGPLEIRYGDAPLTINSVPQRSLLLHLALAAGTTVGQRELAELLLPQHPPAHAGALLRTRIARLRRLLESGGASGPAIVSSPTGYRLEATPETLDLLAFRELVAKAADADPETALAGLADALALWRGDPEAADPLHLSIANEHAEAVRAYAALAREVGVPERALKALRGSVSRHELDEPLHAELIQTLAAAGRQAEALAAYERIREALADQLGIDPGERLRAVQLAVLRRQSSPQQVVVQQTPSAPPDFVGRVEELATICGALRRPGAVSSRAVLVNGIAGVGKTALALTAAHHLHAEYPDGQLYADLRGADAVAPAPLQVLGRFLRALGVPTRRISTEAEAAALFRSELADRRVLVLLDNAQDAAQVRSLLPGAGRSDVIVTSRRRLPDLVAAEVVDLEPLAHADAAQLITSTARSLDALAEDVAALAEACGRLPLALRIAGARLATRREWTVADLARRLDDSNRRLSELSLGESSVLNSFQLSYADLGPDAQRAFRLCSLHPGDDFSADSTAILLGLPAVDAERILEDLLEANMLLQHTKNRYRFHDLLGLYARRLLAEDREADAARTRLHSWYAEAVTAATDWAYPKLVRLETHGEPDRFFASEEAALTWLGDELRALVAVVTDEASGDPRLSWRIADQLRGHFLMCREADGWMQVAQAGSAAAIEAGDEVAQVAMLICRSQALAAAGRDDDSLADSLAGHVLAVAVDWTAAAGYTAHQVGWHHLERGTLREADHWMSRSIEWTQDESCSHVRAIALNGLGMTRLYQGRVGEAADLFAEALQSKGIGRPASPLIVQGNLASALRQLGQIDRAADLLGDVLDAYRQESYPRGELSTLDELARLHLQRGEGATALELALRAHDLAIAGRDRKAQAQTVATVAQAHLVFGDTAAAIRYGEKCLKIARGFYPYVETEALLTLATALHHTGNQVSALELAAEAESIAATCGFDLLQAEATAALGALRASEP